MNTFQSLIVFLIPAITFQRLLQTTTPVAQFYMGPKNCVACIITARRNSLNRTPPVCLVEMKELY